jgi:hypothetical protein
MSLATRKLNEVAQSSPTLSRRAILAITCWGAFILALVAFQRDLANLILGPASLDRETLLTLRDPGESQFYHLRLEADCIERLSPSAYTLGKEPYTYFGVAHFGGKILLVQMPASHEGNSVSGLLEPFTPYEKQFVLQRCQAKHPGKELLPFRLNMTRPLWLGVFYFRLVPLLVLLALSIWFTVRAVRQRFMTRYFQCDGCPR